MPNSMIDQQHTKQVYGVEYKHVYALRMMYIAITGLLLLGVTMLSYFIYTNVFEALDEANVIIVLQSDLQMKTINFERLETVETTWERKQNISPFKVKFNPFFSSATNLSTSTQIDVVTTTPVLPTTGTPPTPLTESL